MQIVCVCLNSGETGDADFGAHALLHEGTELALIVDLDNLLRPIGRVGDVELHLDGGCAVKTVARDCRQVRLKGSAVWIFRIAEGWCSECVCG
jgi:hypothetical protein